RVQVCGGVRHGEEFAEPLVHLTPVSKPKRKPPSAAISVISVAYGTPPRPGAGLRGSFEPVDGGSCLESLHEFRHPDLPSSVCDVGNKGHGWRPDFAYAGWIVGRCVLVHDQARAAPAGHIGRDPLKQDADAQAGLTNELEVDRSPCQP